MSKEYLITLLAVSVVSFLAGNYFAPLSFRYQESGASYTQITQFNVNPSTINSGGQSKITLSGVNVASYVLYFRCAQASQAPSSTIVISLLSGNTTLSCKGGIPPIFLPGNTSSVLLTGYNSRQFKIDWKITPAATFIGNSSVATTTVTLTVLGSR